mgnify:FL=1
MRNHCCGFRRTTQRKWTSFYQQIVATVLTWIFLTMENWISFATILCEAQSVNPTCQCQVGNPASHTLPHSPATHFTEWIHSDVPFVDRGTRSFENPANLFHGTPCDSVKDRPCYQSCLILKLVMTTTSRWVEVNLSRCWIKMMRIGGGWKTSIGIRDLSHGASCGLAVATVSL